MQLATKERRKTLSIHSLARFVSVSFTIGMVVGLFWGCSTTRVAGVWTPTEIVADGIDKEWPGDPLHVDDDLQMAIRVVNDNQSIALCIVSGGESFKRQLRMDGLTVWLDPKGGKENVFGIHLPGGSPMNREHRPSVRSGGGPSDNEGLRPGAKQPQGPPLEPLKQVDITYCDATGPLSMAMDEVRRTGIEIAVGNGPARSLVYEFKIAFKAAPSLADLAPGMVIGVGILSGGGEAAGRQPAKIGGDRGRGGLPDGGGGGGPGPGGRMGWPGGMMGGEQRGGDPGGPSGDSKKAGAGIWLQMQLADGAEG